MEEPLNIKKLMNINHNVIKDAEKIYKEYVRNFSTNKEADRRTIGVMMLQASPLLLELEQYYNGELVSSYAMFKALRNNRTDYRINAFYNELFQQCEIYLR